tara:strand:- start:233 stop:406 length:174 start_codon:yes stop_codon:yes gene_type:complete
MPIPSKFFLPEFAIKNRKLMGNVFYCYLKQQKAGSGKRYQPSRLLNVEAKQETTATT